MVSELEYAEELGERAKESIHKMRDLVAELKGVEEYENAILEDEPLRKETP